MYTDTEIVAAVDFLTGAFNFYQIQEERTEEEENAFIDRLADQFNSSANLADDEDVTDFLAAVAIEMLYILISEVSEDPATTIERLAREVQKRNAEED